MALTPATDPGQLLYYKCMTPNFLKQHIQGVETTGSNDTELAINTDAQDFEVILDVPLFGRRRRRDPDRNDLTVCINVAAEGPKPSKYDPLSVCVTDRQDVVGVQLRDPSEYAAADKGPYMGISGEFGPILRNPKMVKSNEKEEDFQRGNVLRWPQMFNIKLKPNPAGGLFSPAWGLCSSAVNGGTSLSFLYDRKLNKVDDNLDLILYRYKSSETYTINMIEVSVYGDAEY